MLVVPRLACPSWRWMMFSGHALTRELNGVRVAQLVRGEPTPDPGADCEPAELGTDRGTRPRPPAGGAIDDAKQRTDRQLDARLQPRAELFPAPLVHADLAARAALAVADQQRPATRVEVVLQGGRVGPRRCRARSRREGVSARFPRPVRRRGWWEWGSAESDSGRPQLPGLWRMRRGLAGAADSPVFRVGGNRITEVAGCMCVASRARNRAASEASALVCPRRWCRGFSRARAPAFGGMVCR
jgi:hypothetical protein